MTKALFWDFDGTLVHPNESFLYSLQSALRKYGYEISDEDVRTFLHSVCPWYTPDITYPHEAGDGWWDRMFGHTESFFAKHQVKEIHRQQINSAFRENVVHFPYLLYEDTKRVLESCGELGYVNYVISNNYPELTEVIARLGLAQYFEDCFISAHFGYEKPQPFLFQKALGTAGFPEECWMIGDNPMADIQGAKAAGMKAILVHRDGDSAADYHCQSLEEIPEILSQ